MSCIVSGSGTDARHGHVMDQTLKYRLTGAIILVSVAVIFIPVILEGPDNEWAPLSHGIPEAPQLDYRASMVNPDPVKAQVPARPARKIAQKPVYKPAKSAVKNTPLTQQKKVSPALVKSVQGSPGGWYVQVGSFYRELNASGLGKRLELSGYEARIQQATTETGYVWRVIVGPSRTRDVAEKLRDRLVREPQLKDTAPLVMKISS